MLRIQVEEQRELVLEVQFDRPDRAIAVLGQDDLGDVLVLRFLVVVIFAIQEGNDVRILFQGPRFAEVTEHGSFILPAFDASAELGQGDERHFQFPRQGLEGAGNLGDFLLPAFGITALHELQIVDDDQVQAVFRFEAPRLRAHFGDGNARRIVDINRRFIELVAGIGQARPFFIAVELACAQFLRIDMGNLAEQSLDELFLRHFQGKEGHRLMLADADVLGDVQGKGRLAHTRPGSDQDQV